ncbi:MAG: hypothetical protein ABW352_25865 [Polyangiales bacterium]
MKTTPTHASSEVVFRGVLPSDALLATVREQDALLCSVLSVWPAMRRTEISRQPAAFRVRASGVLDGDELSGQAEHPQAEVAVQRAYSELLRSLLMRTRPLAA